jgi:hypothetical protein
MARDAGMAQALSHAEDDCPRWGEVAYAALCLFAGRNHGPFTSFQFREWAADCISSPSTPKAFGSIFARAARAGIIRKIGYQPHPERHASPTVLWEAT